MVTLISVDTTYTLGRRDHAMGHAARPAWAGEKWRI